MYLWTLELENWQVAMFPCYVFMLLWCSALPVTFHNLLSNCWLIWVYLAALYIPFSCFWSYHRVRYSTNAILRLASTLLSFLLWRRHTASTFLSFPTLKAILCGRKSLSWEKIPPLHERWMLRWTNQTPLELSTLYWRVEFRWFNLD